jgi:Flp pilus assembly protein TadG
LLSTSFGILFFLGFLFFAVQLLFNLYATSVVTSTTYDAARSVAASGHTPTEDDCERATQRALQSLGRYARHVSFDCDVQSDPDVVKMRVHAENPRFLGPTIDSLVGFDVIDRTVVVRVEQFR